MSIVDLVQEGLSDPAQSRQRHVKISRRDQAAAARASRVTSSIQLANLTPGMPSGNGVGDRSGGGALPELPQEID
jgi:hypothetical protein